MIKYDMNDCFIEKYLNDEKIRVGMDGTVERKFKDGWRVVNPAVSDSGYHRVTVYDEGIRRKLLVHRIVMVNFYGSKNMEIDHIDCNKLNNNLVNLRYTTRSENCKKRANKPTGCMSRALTEDEVQEMRELKASGMSQNQLCKQFGISPRTCKIRVDSDYSDWVSTFNAKYTFQGKSVRQYCIDAGLHYFNVAHDIRSGKTIEEAITAEIARMVKRTQKVAA